MNIYIFQRISELTDNYHSGGGLVVIAESLSRVLELAGRGGIGISSEELESVIVHKLSKKDTSEGVFIFPDAGCC
jgi:hypothetical protein